MKKIIALVMAASLCAALICGCGKKEEPSAASAGTPDGTAAETPTQAAATQAAAPQDGMVDPHWFDDAVFVGDSITTTLEDFCFDDPNLLGDADFVCADSLSYHNAQWDLNDENAVHPTIQGETVLAETAAEITGSSKIFILMGINDIDTYGVEDTMASMKEFIRKVLSHSPNVEIYLQSTTPMIPAKETDILNNVLIRQFDEELELYCNENGYHYLDVYHRMCDENGALRADYCVDPEDDGIHFTYDATIVWVNYLRSAVAG
ncbi:MAG: hypothetical protein II513_07210 [Ruminococcus sp.]|nr:hypothetical protein [Ruminococcus sp.]MBQ2475118.1 hypothetical protein [Ruminococcus sp.]